MTASAIPAPRARVAEDETTVQRAVELRHQAIYQAELLILQPLEQALLKLLWLLPPVTPVGMSGVVAMVQQLQWRTGNGRVAAPRARRPPSDRLRAPARRAGDQSDGADREHHRLLPIVTRHACRHPVTLWASCLTSRAGGRPQVPSETGAGGRGGS